MPLRFELYESHHIPMALAFNQRIIASGVDPGVRLSDQPSTFNANLPLSTEARVVVEGEHIHGGYLLQWRDFWIDGKLQRVCAYQTPISEGIIDRKYASVGVAMVRHALSVNPLLYAVGMGGPDRPLPRMLKALGFALTRIPFVFRVNHPRQFLRHIEYLRSSSVQRVVMDVLRISGIGWMGLQGWRLSHSVRHHVRSVRFDAVDTLDHVADETWEQSRGEYSFLAVRSSSMLRLLFPGADAKYRRIQVRRGNRRVGWAVVVEKQMQRNKYFGDMKIGVIADCLARQADAQSVVQAAANCLSDAGVDMTLANFQHPTWIAGCRRTGFFSGPSNHCLTLSPKIVDMLQPIDVHLASSVHVSRSDSDGLTNL